MNRVFAFLPTAVLATAVGCGYYDQKPVEEVDISGTVAAPEGKTVTGLNVYFQPASTGAQPAGFKLAADGSFSGRIKYGTYTYFLVSEKEGDPKAEAVLKGLPEGYKKGDANRTVKASGGRVELKW
jgi:hypothetical protein